MELTSIVQRRFKFLENSLELYAERVNNRGLCAVAQAESLRYKLLGGLAVRRKRGIRSENPLKMKGERKSHERESSRDREPGDSRERVRDRDQRSRNRDRYHDRDCSYNRERDRERERSHSYDSRSHRRSRSCPGERSRDYDRHRRSDRY